MSYRDVEIMGGIGVGGDSYSHYVDPYIPLENEPMGPNYAISNFDSSVNPIKAYPYNPLTYATNSRSYMDSWPVMTDYRKTESGGVSKVPTLSPDYLPSQVLKGCGWRGSQPKCATHANTPSTSGSGIEKMCNPIIGITVDITTLVFILLVVMVIILLSQYNNNVLLVMDILRQMRIVQAPQPVTPTP